MYFSYSYRKLFLLITIVCGVLASLRSLKKRRFLEAIIILATYFLPLYVIFKVKHPLTSFLKNLLQQNVDFVAVIDLISIIILSPILIFWIFWLFLGGYAVFAKNIDLIDYLNNYFRKRYIKSKVVGFSFIILGLLLFLLHLIYIGSGIWQVPFVTVSLFVYFIGAICVVIPTYSESKINEIIGKITMEVKDNE